MPPSSELDDNYAGAFAGHLDFGNQPALLIVDFVMAYLDPSSPLYAGVEGALASAERMLEAARKANIPVIFTNVEYEPGGSNGGLFYQKIPALSVFDRGNPLGDFPLTLQPTGDDLVVTKQYASAFFGTGLSDKLEAMGVDTLLIIGLSTSGCVRATALDALQSGFIPFVVRDACGDRHPEPHEANLFDLQAKYAEVVSETDAIGFLETQQD